MSESSAPSEIAAIESAALPRSFTAEEKAQWVEKFLASGLSIRKFGERHHIPRMSLWRWVEGAQADATVKDASSEVGFAEIPMPAGRCEWAVELTLPNGTVLRMTKEVPSAIVEQLLRVC